jgi:hypothetical protein
VPGKRYSALDLAADANRFDAVHSQEIENQRGAPRCLASFTTPTADSSWHGFRKRVDKCSRMKNIA